MSRNRQPPAGGDGPAFTPRETVEKIVKEMIAGGAFDQAMLARLQTIADPLCRMPTAEELKLALDIVLKRGGEMVYIPRRKSAQ